MILGRFHHIIQLALTFFLVMSDFPGFRPKINQNSPSPSRLFPFQAVTSPGTWGSLSTGNLEAVHTSPFASCLDRLFFSSSSLTLIISSFPAPLLSLHALFDRVVGECGVHCLASAGLGN